MEPFADSSLLGKYLTAASALAVLKNGTLRWSQPHLFNDPFDSKPRFRFSIDKAKALERSVPEFHRVMQNTVPFLSIQNEVSRLLSAMRLGLESGRATIATYEQHFADFVSEFFLDMDAFCSNFYSNVVMECQDIKILCLTKNLNQSLMWSHYADSHKGALFLFAPRSHDSFFRCAEKVSYSDSGPEIFDLDDLVMLLTGQLSMTDRSFVEKAYKKITLTKSEDWAYENEYRVTLGIGRQPDSDFEYSAFTPIDLIGLVFGLNATEEFIEKVTVVARARYRHLKFWKAVRSRAQSSVEYQAYQ